MRPDVGAVFLTVCGRYNCVFVLCCAVFVRVEATVQSSVLLKNYYA